MIRSGVCHSYLREILAGKHRPEHAYYLALFLNETDLSPETEAYNRAGEISGLGYPAGGFLLRGFRVSGSKKGCLDFDSVHVDVATITTDGGIIYNKTLGGNAVMVVRFSERLYSTNGSFDLDFPQSGENTSLIRVS